MKYQADLSKDLPMALTRIVARKTCIIGEVVVTEVVDGIDLVARYNVMHDGAVWIISMSDRLKARFGMEDLVFYRDAPDGSRTSFNVPLEVYLCSKPDELTFCCRVDAANWLLSYGIGYEEYRESHALFPEDRIAAFPAHLADTAETAEEEERMLAEWDARQVEKVWPVYMDRIQNAFWSFLNQPLDDVLLREQDYIGHVGMNEQ